MADPIIQIIPTLSHPHPSELERTAYAAVDALLKVEGERIPYLWWAIAHAQYAAQPPAVLREDHAVVCPHCGEGTSADVMLDGAEDYSSIRAIALQTEREYVGQANGVTKKVKVEPDDQAPDDWGLLLYLECSECDRTFRAPAGYELDRS